MEYLEHTAIDKAAEERPKNGVRRKYVLQAISSTVGTLGMFLLIIGLGEKAFELVGAGFLLNASGTYFGLHFGE